MGSFIQSVNFYPTVYENVDHFLQYRLYHDENSVLTTEKYYYLKGRKLDNSHFCHEQVYSFICLFKGTSSL